MLFNFKETYASRSNEELAQIVAHPGKYQPEAVTAAKDLLAERDVTEDELQDMISPPKIAAQDNGSTVQYEDGHTNIFEDLQRRPLSDQTKKRMAFISLVWGALCLYNFVNRAYNYYMLLRYPPKYGPGYTMTFLNMLIGLLPAAWIYLLYKRKKWGWILAAGYMCYYLASMTPWLLRMLTSMISTDDDMVANRLVWLGFMALYAVSLAFLAGKEFRGDFTISRKIMWRTVFAGAGAFGLYMLYGWALDNFF